VIDGPGAGSGRAKVFGEAALIQRCTIHKRRNVSDHLSETERSPVDAELARAFATPIPPLGCVPPASWPAPCRPATPAPPPVCEKAWRRCSPSAGWASPSGWCGR
jgi:hypothetical protein